MPSRRTEDDEAEAFAGALGPLPGRRSRRRRSAASLLVAGVLLAGAGTAIRRDALEGEPDSATPRTTSAALAPPAVAASAAATAPVTTAPPAMHVLHAVYVLPDGVVEVQGRVEAIRHEVAVLGAWFTEQSGGGHPRFAMDGEGRIEVSVVRLPAGEPQIWWISPQVDAAIDAAQRDGLLMFVEGPPPPGSEECGVTLHDWSAAAVWLGACDNVPDARSRFSDGATAVAAHEVVHVLGAVYECAPHDDALGHVTDDPDDLMAATHSGDRRRAIVLDAGRDDYLTTNPECQAITASPLWEPAPTADPRGAGAVGATPGG